VREADLTGTVCRDGSIRDVDLKDAIITLDKIIVIAEALGLDLGLN